MAHGFQRSDSGRFVAGFDTDERALLLTLARDLAGFIRPEQLVEHPLGILETAEISDDPALARLFPDAYDLDDEAADDFRRYTEQDLRAAKGAHLTVLADTVEASGDKTVLTEAQATSWMVALNDIRLVIGTRLHLDDEDEPEFEDEYVEQLGAVYQWLTWLQESLVGALMDD